MKDRLGGANEFLNKLTNRQLIEKVFKSDSVTPVELELALRLEGFIEIHGDYMTEL
jgi:hypothetical protein